MSVCALSAPLGTDLTLTYQQEKISKVRGAMAEKNDVHIPTRRLVHPSLAVGDETFPMPDWASWLIWLGEWMKLQTQNDGRRVAVVRVPCRRTAAAFTVLGVLLASARIHDDSLDWESLKSLPVGTQVYWRERSLADSGKARAKSGKVIGLSTYGDHQLMVVSVDSRSKQGQTTHSFSKVSALSYGITLGSISAKTDAKLSSLNSVLNAMAVAFKPSWLVAPNSECLLLSEKDSFLSDLAGLSIDASDGIPVKFESALAIADSRGHSYGKTKLASPRIAVIPDQWLDVVVLDGPYASQRLPDTAAKSAIAILDRTEYDDEIEQMIGRLTGYRRDEFIQIPDDGVLQPPKQMDVVLFGLPNVQAHASGVASFG